MTIDQITDKIVNIERILLSGTIATHSTKWDELIRKRQQLLIKLSIAENPVYLEKTKIKTTVIPKQQ